MDKYLRKALEATVSAFKNDLKAFSDDALEEERNQVADHVDIETSWLEAICAEQSLREVSSKKKDDIIAREFHSQKYPHTQEGRQND